MPGARLESIEVTPPGKMTVIMVQEFYKIPPPGVPSLPQALAGCSFKSSSESNPLDDNAFGVARYEFVGGIAMSSGSGSGGPQGISSEEFCEISIGLDQVPLGHHWKIKEIMKTFSGTLRDGELSFPLKDPTGLSKRKAIDDDGSVFHVNPFYGVNSYFMPRMTFKLERKRTGDFRALGEINSPPWSEIANITPIGTGRKAWLKSQMTEETRGTEVFLSEEWLFSYEGWEPMIYT